MHDCAVVYGALRSGTTLLRLMLDAHPAAHCSGEHDFLFDFLKRAPDGGWQHDRARLEDNRIFQASGVRFPGERDGAAACADMVAQIAGRGPGRPVLMLHRNLPVWSALLPDAPVVHLVRDPRDVARSSVRMGWAGNVHAGLRPWLDTEAAWAAAPAALRARALHMRYEDLVAHPEAELRRLCAFLGLDYAPQMLRYDAHTSYARPDPSLAFQWRGKATRREIRLVEGRASALMEPLGYTPSGHGAHRPGRAELAWLAVQNKAANFRFGVRRYGLSRALRLRAARLFGRAGAERAVRREMAAVDRDLLR